jgi:formate hydrogenlyase subunit 3/multisubunit Na+/H+ antiporter MnhD subunit
MSIFPKSIIICFIINTFSILTLNYPNYGHLALNDFFTIIGILNIIFGTFSSLNQTDMKRIIMYSSLANIGYIFIAMGANYYVFSVAYSYIIHYTIALFILFRVLNHIEIDQKFSFKQ